LGKQKEVQRVVKKKESSLANKAEHVNILVRHRGAKKIWEAIRTVVKKDI
jgi:hypothetical protein